MIRDRIDIIALAGLVIALFIWLREDIKEIRQTTNDLSERLARVEGMLTGLEQSVASLNSSRSLPDTDTNP